MLKIVRAKPKKTILQLSDHTNKRLSRTYLAKFRQTAMKLKVTNWELFMMLETQSLDEIRKEKLHD